MNAKGLYLLLYLTALKTFSLSTLDMYLHSLTSPELSNTFLCLMYPHGAIPKHLSTWVIRSLSQQNDWPCCTAWPTPFITPMLNPDDINQADVVLAVCIKQESTPIMYIKTIENHCPLYLSIQRLSFKIIQRNKLWEAINKFYDDSKKFQDDFHMKWLHEKIICIITFLFRTRSQAIFSQSSENSCLVL